MGIQQCDLQVGNRQKSLVSSIGEEALIRDWLSPLNFGHLGRLSAACCVLSSL